MKRIYIVRTYNRAEDVQLIRASSKSAAIRFAARNFTVEVAGQDGLVQLIQGGIKIEEGN